MTSIFLWLPKTAGLSIYDALKPHGIKRRLDLGTFSGVEIKDWKPKGGGLMVDDVERAVDKIWEQSQAQIVTYGHVSLSALNRAGLLPAHPWIFTIIRNPYSRAVSLWAYLKQKGSLGPRMDFREFCLVLRDRAVEPIGLYNKRGLSQCRPQADWLRGVYVGYFGRFETLQSDFDNICDKLKVPRGVLTHRNRGAHDDYREYYDAETQGIVRDYYAEDFELLAYSEEL